jgi:hypothetical protein
MDEWWVDMKHFFNWSTPCIQLLDYVKGMNYIPKGDGSLV